MHLVLSSRRGLWASLLFLVFCTSFLAKLTWATEVDVEEEDIIDLDSDEYYAEQEGERNVSAGIHAFGKLANPFNIISNGEYTDVAISVLNLLETDAQILHAQGVLMTPSNLGPDDKKLPPYEDFKSRQVIRNVSNFVYNRDISSFGNMSLNYQFVLDIEPGKYGLGVLLTVRYLLNSTKEEGGKTTQNYATQTLLTMLSDVTIVDTTYLFDLQSLGIYILLAAIFGGVVYLNVYNNPLAKRTRKKIAKAAQEAAPVSASDVSEDWLPDHVVKHSKKGGKKNASKK